MIERRADPNNGLKKQLFLLPAGVEVLRQVNDAFEEVNQLVGTVDPDTLAKLEKISIDLEKQILRKKN